MEQMNPYRIVNLVQGSPEWHEYRRWKIGASDISTILGTNNFKTPYQLYQEKVDGKIPFVTDAMRRGTLLESEGRDKANEILGASYKPLCIESISDDYMFCSLDGMDDTAEIKIIEIKCPSSLDSHALSVDDKVPSYYIAQLQMQMFVANADAAYYVSYFPEHIIPIAIVLVKRDQDLINRMLPAAKDFFIKIINFDPPELTSKDYKIVTEFELVDLAKERAQLKNECDDAMKRVDEIDAILKSKITENSIIGPLKICRSTRKGSIEYEKIPELQSVDIEHYRKKNTVYWTIRQKD